jgi:uncharacterized protein
MTNQQTTPGGAPPTPNRLAAESSPYLRQHGHNPVDWYPWGPEAFERARSEDKPIHLSVGYHACHWCHVMAHESFEDPATAQIMNEHFVNIKVDREERPDIDGIYMTAVQAMTGGGGWPMTVFMSPDGAPFYGGTYFPPEDRYNMPAFRRVLLSVAEAYRSRRADLLRAGEDLVERIRLATAERLADGQVAPATLDEAYAVLHGQFDQELGGFGRAPKFPQPMVLDFLLRYAARTGQRLAGEMLERTLLAMAEGGIYDQLGGGFHRYSVDAEWLVPHFEKMLYDNALLARTYIDTYQATGDQRYRTTAEETLDYLLREMRHPDGGFYSTQDADSLPHAGAAHAEEGAFFVWSRAEVRDLLGADAMAFEQIFDVTDHGNFEGKNILRVRRQPAAVARVLGLDAAQIDALIARSRRTLLDARAGRPRPNLDDKVLAAWNGMAIRALAAAARALGREDYRDAARGCAKFVLTHMRTPEGALLRSWRDGSPGATRGFLEDHALLADGLLALYEATFEEEWLIEAQRLAETILAEFWDDALGGFYDTASGHEQLVVRPRDTGDNATPCGSSVAADLLLRLATIADRADYRAHAEQVLGGMQPFMERYPGGFGRYLCAAEYALAPTQEVVIVGDPADAATQALIAEVSRGFAPSRVVLLLRPGGGPLADLPLALGREQIGGRPTVYVCRNYACRMPVADAAALRAELLEA